MVIFQIFFTVQRYILISLTVLLRYEQSSLGLILIQAGSNRYANTNTPSTYVHTHTHIRKNSWVGPGVSIMLGTAENLMA